MTAKEHEEYILQLAQMMLTALNGGDIKTNSLLHLKLRKTMIEYREALRNEN